MECQSVIISENGLSAKEMFGEYYSSFGEVIYNFQTGETTF